MSLPRDLRVEHHDGVPVVRLEGELDISKAADLREGLVGVVTNEDFGLVLDLTAVTYLDSSAITVLFALADRLRARQQLLTAVVPASAMIRRVLGLVHMESAVPLFDDLRQAVARVRELAPEGAGPNPAAD